MICSVLLCPCHYSTVQLCYMFYKDQKLFIYIYIFFFLVNFMIQSFRLRIVYCDQLYSIVYKFVSCADVYDFH